MGLLESLIVPSCSSASRTRLRLARTLQVRARGTRAGLPGAHGGLRFATTPAFFAPERVCIAPDELSDSRYQRVSPTKSRLPCSRTSCPMLREDSSIGLVERRARSAVGGTRSVEPRVWEGDRGGMGGRPREHGKVPLIMRKFGRRARRATGGGRSAAAKIGTTPTRSHRVRRVSGCVPDRETRHHPPCGRARRALRVAVRPSSPRARRPRRAERA